MLVHFDQFLCSDVLESAENTECAENGENSESAENAIFSPSTSGEFAFLIVRSFYLGTG